MGESTVVAGVGLSLRNMLASRMDDLNLGELRNRIVLASPGALDAQDAAVLTLFLYRVAENPSLKNAERREVPPAGPGDERRYRPSPLSLDLYYLLTTYPHGPSETHTDEASNQHKLLGRAMQVLGENSVLRGSDLHEWVADDDELRLSIYPEQSEDLLSIWNTFSDRPYQPSVAYVVSPVEIDATQTTPLARTKSRAVRSGLRRPEDGPADGGDGE
ncbi:DUF4255 domain-containing protein [Halogeometricum limi]|uniref:DUF4255 domain-containing protein n=1 Tax=Halogeometricum limi TaxID=555875 RepID=UPI00111405CB|nr:DUF4255 domain-containing protein [Halogeometricum limi]